MYITVHQKIQLRNVLLKYGVNVNRLCTLANNSSIAVRNEARKQLAFLINYCTGKGVMFVLKHPYTKSFKSHRSTLSDGEPRHSF